MPRTPTWAARVLGQDTSRIGTRPEYILTTAFSNPHSITCKKTAATGQETGPEPKVCLAPSFPQTYAVLRSAASRSGHWSWKAEQVRAVQGSTNQNPLRQLQPPFQSSDLLEQQATPVAPCRPHPSPPTPPLAPDMLALRTFYCPLVFIINEKGPE